MPISLSELARTKIRLNMLIDYTYQHDQLVKVIGVIRLGLKEMESVWRLTSSKIFFNLEDNYTASSY